MFGLWAVSAYPPTAYGYRQAARHSNLTAAFVGSIPTSPVSTLITQSAKISAKNLLDGDEDNT